MLGERDPQQQQQQQQQKQSERVDAIEIGIEVYLVGAGMDVPFAVVGPIGTDGDRVRVPHGCADAAFRRISVPTDPERSRVFHIDRVRFLAGNSHSPGVSIYPTTSNRYSRRKCTRRRRRRTDIGIIIVVVVVVVTKFAIEAGFVGRYAVEEYMEIEIFENYVGCNVRIAFVWLLLHQVREHVLGGQVVRNRPVRTLDDGPDASFVDHTVGTFLLGRICLVDTALDTASPTVLQLHLRRRDGTTEHVVHESIQP